MSQYFFDLTAGAVVAVDDEGLQFKDVDVAYEEAVAALAKVIETGVAQGLSGQAFAIEVRDQIGPVFRLTATVSSEILRKQ